MKQMAFIDDKDVCTDFLYEMADSNVASTEEGRWATGLTTKCLFYKFGHIWEVVYSNKSGIMRFNNVQKMDPAQMEDCLRELFSDCNEDLVVEVKRQDMNIVVEFYHN